MYRSMDIVVFKPNDETETYSVDENDAKVLSRAIELMYLVRGNISIVLKMLSLETGMSQTMMLGYAQIAEAIHKDVTSVSFGAWKLAE